MEQLVADVRRHPDSWPFREPVSVAEAPDYYDIIKNPVDLTTVEARLGQQRYVTLELLAADLRVMFSNCRVYNAPDTVYYKLAARMEHYVDDQLAANTVFE